MLKILAIAQATAVRRQGLGGPWKQVNGDKIFSINFSFVALCSSEKKPSLLAQSAHGSAKLRNFNCVVVYMESFYNL